MAQWLLKSEPDCYSWDDLVRDKKTTWDGITNALALKHLRTMKKGDLALIYHTGNQKQVVGLAQLVSNPYPNPKEADERLAVIDLKPKSKLKSPVTLDTIKSDPAFKGWDLIRNSRLSVVPVPDPMWHRIQQLTET
ncbi:MAG TPA: EVE domain-containing protein [Tepidisphaeraceae bacterium]|jgi:predicted RNA-binding protein with PUA-like domain|nr:EVE domain-containing protein [Tepidisphaeraceae bacterium]